MAKFTKSQMKKSLLENITLMECEDNTKWVEFDEIWDYNKIGYEIVNDKKREIFEKMKK